MMKLKSSLTCIVVSLLMVFFFSGLVHGLHPWVELPPGKSDDNPSGNKGNAPGTSKAPAYSSDFSQIEIFSTIVYDVSTVLVDFVYGENVSKVKTRSVTTGSQSK